MQLNDYRIKNLRYFLHSLFTFRRNNDILRRYDSLPSLENMKFSSKLLNCDQSQMMS